MNIRKKDPGLQLLALMVNRLLGSGGGGLAREISVDDLSLHVRMRNGVPLTHVELAVPLDKRLRATCRADYVASETGLDGLVRTAEAFAGTVQDLCRRSGELSEMVRQVAEKARSCAAAARRAGQEVRVVNVRLATIDGGAGDAHAATVRLAVLGNALTTRPHVFQAITAEEVAEEFRGMARWQAPLGARKAELAAVGANGTIDPVSLAALPAYGMDVAKLMSEVSRAADDVVVVGDGFRFVWDAGRAGASVPLAPGVRYGGGLIQFDACPVKLGRDLVGRPVSDVLEHPWLPVDALITGANGEGGTKGHLRFTPQDLHFNVQSGAVW